MIPAVYIRQWCQDNPGQKDLGEGQDSKVWKTWQVNPSAPPYRTGKTRTRLGCIACKKRKVKCDEAKPRCRNCTRRGDSCTFSDRIVVESKQFIDFGNANTLTQPSKEMIDEAQPANHPKQLESQNAWNNWLPIGDQALSFDLHGTSQEKRAFDRFRVYAVPQLSGFFDAWLWNKIILQASHQEPAIKHAVLALSSLVEHRSFTASSARALPLKDTANAFAIRHYNQAIEILNYGDSKHELAVDVCLITCILFAYIEVVRRRHGAALFHINSGAKILTGLVEETGNENASQRLSIATNPYLDVNDLTILFCSMNINGTQLAGLPCMNLEKFGCGATGFCPDIPPSFVSLEEAQNSFQYYWNRSDFRKPDVSHRPIIERFRHPHFYLRVSRKWHLALQSFLQNNEHTLSEVDKVVAKMMQLNHYYLVLELEIAAQDRDGRIVWENDKPRIDPLAWDEHTPQFQNLNDVAREITQGLTEKSSDKCASRYALDMNIVGTLFCVANNCRDPNIRREAVRLTKVLPKQESLWDSAITALVCERIVMLEERGLMAVRRADDIPLEARIVEVKLNFDMEGKAVSIDFRRHNESSPSGDTLYLAGLG